MPNIQQDIPEKTYKENLKKRAKAKYLTNQYLYELINENSALKKSYWNTYHCPRLIEKKGGKKRYFGT